MSVICVSSCIGTQQDVSNTNDAVVNTVSQFATDLKNEDVAGCYSLMSQEYKNGTDFNSFKYKVASPPGTMWYEVIGYVQNSESINNNSGSLEIEYREEFFPSPLDKVINFVSRRDDTKTRTVNLVNESGEWKFNEIYYELNGKSFLPKEENQ